MERVTSFLSDNVLSTKRTTLIEKGKIINNDSETGKIMNTFFSNIVTNPIVPEYHNCEEISGNTSDPSLKAITEIIPV